MPVYRFEYESLDEIQEECQRLKLDIIFSQNVDILYEPVTVGGRRLGNRLAILPMEGADAGQDGKPGDLTYHRWRRYAAGGAKLIWGEAAAVVPEGRSNPRQLVVNEHNASSLAALVKQTRDAHRHIHGDDKDLLIGIQLTHAGRHCFENPAIAVRSPVHDRFTFLDKRTGERLPDDYPVVTDDYLEQLEDRFADAARVARDAGFDFVDIKQCHSYLLNELLSARTREGKYGGKFRNRRQFIRNVVGKVLDAVGKDIVLASRISVYDGVPYVKDDETGDGKPIDYPLPYEWGWGVSTGRPQKEDLKEPMKLIDMLSSNGVSMFGISIGSPYWSPHFVRPFTTPVKGGYKSPEHPLVGVNRLFRMTAEIQHTFQDVAVVGAGYSWLRQFLLNAGAQNAAMQSVRIVGVGRTAFAYPDFASDGEKGKRLDSKKVCLSDSLCSNMLRSYGESGDKSPAGCPVRDAEYKEMYKRLGKD